MISIFIAQNRMNRIYKSPRKSLYNHRFFEDLCSGYSYTLGEKNCRKEFLTFEPNGCKMSKIIKERQHYDLSYEIEQIVSRVIYSLLVFGKSYIYLTPEYSVSVENEKEVKKLSSMGIGEIKGYVKKRNRDQIVFCCKGFNGKIDVLEMQGKQIIELDIKDMGFKKRYFVNIHKKLSKCDITQISTLMISNNTKGYDFSVHSRKRKIQELKVTKEIGWSFGVDGLSDSYILYKKIQEDKLKLRFLEYVIEKINEGLKKYKDEADGLLVAHVKKKNYEQLWNDYLSGKITGSELTNFLYH